MRNRVLSVVAGLVLGVVAVSADQTISGAAALEAARKVEVVDGELATAAARYQEIADQYAAADPATAAQALRRQAEIYERLGDQRMRATLARIVADFPRQPEAAEARAALAAPRQASYASVWSGPKVDFTGSVSADGRYISYIDWVGQGNVAIRDLTTNMDRHVTTDGGLGSGGGFAENSVISRDGTQIAYSWHRNPGIGIRVMSLESTDGAWRDINENPEIREAYPHDWSPDGQWLAVQMRRGDSTLIGLMSVADGSVRQIKSIEWTRRASKIALSPDGRFIAFDLGNEDGRTRHVSILAVDGTQQQDVVTHASQNLLVGWAPDGSHLLFMSDRRGNRDLWAVPVHEGRAIREARLLKSDVGTRFLGMTRTGAMYFGVSLGQRDITVVSVDMATGARLSTPTKPVSAFVGTNRYPDWSADGKRLAYISQRPHLNLLGILDIETGRTREFALPTMTYFQLPSWAPDGDSVAVEGSDQQGRRGIFRVSVQDGRVTPIALRRRGASQAPRWSPDGTTIYYRSDSIMVLDVATGTERRLRSGDCGPDPEPDYGLPTVSPDGRLVATLCLGASAEASVVVIPVDGGAVRELGRLPVASFRQVSWSADGMSVIVMKMVKAIDTTTAEAELWAYPIDGSSPRKLDVPLSHAGIWSPVRVHPDGRQIAYVEGEDRQEVWKLEHVLP